MKTTYVLESLICSVVLYFIFCDFESLDHIRRVKYVSEQLAWHQFSLFSEPSAALIALISVVLGGGVELFKSLLFLLACLIFRFSFSLSSLYLVVFAVFPQGQLLLGNITPYFIGSLILLALIWRECSNLPPVPYKTVFITIFLALTFHWSMIFAAISFYWLHVFKKLKLALLLVVILFIGIALIALFDVNLVSVMDRIKSYSRADGGNRLHILFAYAAFVFIFVVSFSLGWIRVKRVAAGLIAYMFILSIVDFAIGSKAASRLAFFLDVVLFVVLSQLFNITFFKLSNKLQKKEHTVELQAKGDDV